MPKIENKKPVITDEIATSSKDLDIFFGWINRLENPDPTLRTEAKGKGLKLYDEVDRDPHAGSVLQTRYLAVVGKEWDVLPAESARKTGRPAATTQEQKVADFVKGTLKATNFEQAMQEILQAILYGFFVAEVIWKVKDGAIAISKIRSKHPRRFSFTQDRALRLLTPQNMIEGEELPERKFIQFTFGSSDNPYGKGLGQKLWWPVWFKKHGIKFWLVFLEKFGMPTAVGKYPPGTDPDQQQKLLDAIDALQNETGVKIPDTMAIDLLEASRTGKVTYETICEYMDKQISKAVLGQTATTEGTPGKLGNEGAQEDVRQDILEADASLLCELLNETLIPWIVDYNFPSVTDYPSFVIRTEKEKDLKPLAERDKVIAEIGLPVGKRYFYDTYGIPEPEEAEEVLGAELGKMFEYHMKYGAVTINEVRARLALPPIAGGEKLIQLTTHGSPEFAEGFTAGRRFSKEQQAIEGLVDASMNNSGKAMTGLTGPVQKIVNEAKSLEEIRDKLFQSYSEMDPAEMEDLIARAMYVADLYGRSVVKKG